MRALLKPRAGRSQALTVNESEKWKGAPGWVSGDPGAADLITLQGKACRALTGGKLTEQVWTVTPPSRVMSRVESVPGLAQVSPR